MLPFQLEGIPLVIAFVLAVAFMVFAISKLKVHPFLAILGTAIIVGLLGGIPFINMDGQTGIAGVIGAGFQGIFASLGLVIIFGGIIGLILEHTGAAFKMADIIIRLVGKASPTAAMVLMGWVVSIPVFCDSGFVIVNPVRRSMVKRAGKGGMATALGLGGGLYISHVLVPPTPGPIAAADALGLGEHLLMVIGMGALVSVPIVIVTIIFAQWRGSRGQTAEDKAIAADATVKTYEEIVREYGKMPSGFMSFLPILAPIVMMTLGTIAAILVRPDIAVIEAGGIVHVAMAFVGTPVIALAIGLILAVIVLVTSGKGSQFAGITNDALKVMGPILFITAAGGALGRVIVDSGLVAFISENADVLSGMGLFFPFLVSAIIKTAQGGSTMAIVTTASIMAPLMATLGLDSTMMSVLTVLAIGAGSMMASHANDSYFWVVTKLSDMTPEEGYKNWTTMTLAQGGTAIITIFIISQIYNLIG